MALTVKHFAFFANDFCPKASCQAHHLCRRDGVKVFQFDLSVTPGERNQGMFGMPCPKNVAGKEPWIMFQLRFRRNAKIGFRKSYTAPLRLRYLFATSPAGIRFARDVNVDAHIPVFSSIFSPHQGTSRRRPQIIPAHPAPRPSFLIAPQQPSPAPPNTNLRRSAHRSPLSPPRTPASR